MSLFLALLLMADEGAMARQQASAARQAASVRRQARVSDAGTGFFVLSFEPRGRRASRPPLTGDCGTLGEQELSAIAVKAGEEFGVEARVVRAVIDQESGGRPCVVSPKGAQGLMQIMPATQGELGLLNPFDAAENVRAGTRYLKQLLERYGGKLELALAAYNAGIGRVTDKVPDIEETREYVADVLDLAGRTIEVSRQ